MSKLDEASILESIFAISLSTLISNGEIDRASIGKIRSIVEPKLFAQAYSSYLVSDQFEVKKGQNPSDSFTVRLTIDLTSKDFNTQYDMLYSRSSEVGNINQKISSLISDIQTSIYRLKLVDLRNDFLYNDQNENVTFSVISNGNSQITDSMISGSVEVRAETSSSDGNQTVFDQSIPYNVKLIAPVRNETNPYNIISFLSRSMSLNWKDMEKYSYLLRPALSNSERIKRHELLIKMYNEMASKMIASQVDVNSRVYDFLYKAMYTNEMSDFIHHRDNIPVQSFDAIKSSVKMGVTAVGRNITFIDRNNGVPMFRLRANIRQLPAEELTFSLETTVGLNHKLNTLVK